MAYRNVEHRVMLVGIIESDFAYHHNYKGRNYYDFRIAFKDQFGNFKTAVIVVSEDAFSWDRDYSGETIYLNGRIITATSSDGRILSYIQTTHFKVLKGRNTEFKNKCFVRGVLEETEYVETDLEEITYARIKPDGGFPNEIHATATGRLARYLDAVNEGSRIRAYGCLNVTKDGKDVVYSITITNFKEIENEREEMVKHRKY